MFCAMLMIYLRDAATTVSWSDITYEEMVGLAVVDISSVKTVKESPQKSSTTPQSWLEAFHFTS